MNLKTLSTVVGLALAVPTLGGVSWAAWDLRQEVSENTTWRVIQIWEQMEAIRKKRQLSQLEWAKWCQAGKQLNIFTVCPPR